MTGPTPQVAFSFTARNAAGEVVAQVNRELSDIERRSSGLARTFVSLGTSADGTRKGLTALERGLGSFAAQAINASPPVDALYKSVLLFGGGGELLLAVSAGLAAGAVAAELLGRKSAESAKQVAALAEAAEKLNRSSIADAVANKVTASTKLEEAKKTLAELEQKFRVFTEREGFVPAPLVAARAEVERLQGIYDTLARNVDKVHENTAAHLGQLIALDRERLALLERQAVSASDYRGLAAINQGILDNQVRLSIAKEESLKRELADLTRAKSLDAERVTQTRELLRHQEAITEALRDQASLAGQMVAFLKEFRPDLSAATRIPEGVTDAVERAQATLGARRVGAVDQLATGQFVPSLNAKLLDQLFGPRLDPGRLTEAAFGRSEGPARRYDRFGNEITAQNELEKGAKAATKSTIELARTVGSAFQDLVVSAEKGSDAMVDAARRGFERIAEAAVDTLARRAAVSAGGVLSLGSAIGLAALPVAIGFLSSKLFGGGGRDRGTERLSKRDGVVPVRIEEVNPSIQNDGPETVVLAFPSQGGGVGVDMEQVQVELARRAARDAIPRFARGLNLRRT